MAMPAGVAVRCPGTAADGTLTATLLLPPATGRVCRNNALYATAAASKRNRQSAWRARRGVITSLLNQIKSAAPKLDIRAGVLTNC
jgi:hypothetical protein